MNDDGSCFSQLPANYRLIVYIDVGRVRTQRLGKAGFTVGTYSGCALGPQHSNVFGQKPFKVVQCRPDPSRPVTSVVLFRAVGQNRENDWLVLLTEVQNRSSGRCSKHFLCLVPTTIQHAVPIDTFTIC